MSFAAVEGSKERDEGGPTSGAWGGSVERCLSDGGEAEKKSSFVKTTEDKAAAEMKAK